MIDNRNRAAGAAPFCDATYCVILPGGYFVIGSSPLTDGNRSSSDQKNDRQVNSGGIADERDFHQKAPLRSAIGTIHFAASRSDSSKSFQ
jgi:hypothetical protein